MSPIRVQTYPFKKILSDKSLKIQEELDNISKSALSGSKLLSPISLAV